jgi:molybdenum cofactor cytidylyltransferase
VISGVVLAAGASRRLGRPKQLLELWGRPLLQHSVNAVSGAGLDEVVVVLGHEADAIESALDLPPGARVVRNPDYASGQATSLRVGLAAVGGRAEAAVILLGDQPLLGSGLIRRAVEEFATAGRPVVRCFFGSTPGHPVVVARSEWARLGALSGDVGGRALWDDSERVHVLNVEAEPPADVDTWEQWTRLLERAGSEPQAGPRGVMLGGEGQSPGGRREA